MLNNNCLSNQFIYCIVNNNCNLKCTYCFYENNTLSRKNHAINNRNFLKHLVHKFPNIQRVIFTGGEPTINPILPELIIDAKLQGLEVSLLSNGVYWPRPLEDCIHSDYVDFIAVSLDSTDPIINDKLRCSTNKHPKDNFSMILANLKKLRSAKPKINVSVLQTIHRQSWTDIDSVGELCKEMKMLHHIHPVFIPYEHSKNKQLSINNCDTNVKKEIVKAMMKWAGSDEKRKRYINNIDMLLRGTIPRNISCPMGTRHLVVNPSGAIQTCFLKEAPIGSIYNAKQIKYTGKKNCSTCVSLGCVCLTDRE